MRIRLGPRRCAPRLERTDKPRSAKPSPRWPGTGPRLDADRKRKWLEVAAKYPNLSPEGKQKLHERMAEFSRLTPEQKKTARENFRKAYEVPAEQRQAKVQKYQELPEDKKRELADRAATQRPKRRAARTPTPRSTGTATGQDGTAEAVTTSARDCGSTFAAMPSQDSAVPPRPASLPLRLAAMVYEGVLLFGVTFAVAFAVALRHGLDRTR